MYTSVCVSVHLVTYLYVCLHLSVSIYLSVYQPISLGIHLSLYVPFSLGIHLSPYVSISLSIIHLSRYPAVFLCLCLSLCVPTHLSAYPSTSLCPSLMCPSIFLAIHPSLWVCTHLSVYPSISLCVHLSVCPSISLGIHPSLWVSSSSSVSICLSVYPSISLCVHLCVHLSGYPSVSLHLCPVLTFLPLLVSAGAFPLPVHLQVNFFTGGVSGLIPGEFETQFPVRLSILQQTVRLFALFLFLLGLHELLPDLKIHLDIADTCTPQSAVPETDTSRRKDAVRHLEQVVRMQAFRKVFLEKINSQWFGNAS
ncbi:PREDICTED: uncharacterized protein LOC106148764 [Chinchilla lanigera]|uniref:uncharacterized protein LOC106148764 n=1 Tax=Chinchilla lanigera TaxID=34839 RepID=UPI000698ECA0|nr:PREDICTED: uncharacterized protein LOC106148764 [Chinchilla lanigera]